MDAVSPQPPTPDPHCTAERHGPGWYSRGCRCWDAYLAHKASDYRWRKRRDRFGGRTTVDPAGTHRRLQALNAAGWPWKLLAAELGQPNKHAARDLLRSTRTRRETARAVAELYERLENQPGPSRSAAIRARRKGWLPPEYWFDVDMDDPAAVPTTTNFTSMGYIDEVALERLRRGELRLEEASEEELRVAFSQLRARGESPREIAELLRCDERTVLAAWRREDRRRDRQRLRAG